MKKNVFTTIDDIIDRQSEIPSEYRGNIYAYLIFGMEGQQKRESSHQTDRTKNSWQVKSAQKTWGVYLLTLT